MNVQTREPTRRAVLVGAGHAHLHTIQHAAEFTRRGFELTLLAPGPFWYSGLATGMLGGQYAPALDQVNVQALIERGGGRFVQDCATGFDLSRREILCAQGPPLTFDVVSLNLGSEVPAETIPGLAEHATLVKPIRNLWNLRVALESRFEKQENREPLRIVVIGGGPTACEVAANIRRLAEHRGGSVEVALIASGHSILASLPRGARVGVRDALARRGVHVRTGSSAARVEPGDVILADGSPVPFDVLIGAIGLRPSPLMRKTGLPCDDEGAMLVDEHLRSVANPVVFGGGDCVSLRGRNLAKIGVYAVREAPILCRNLIATLEGRPLTRYRPQRRFLLILNLGDGAGLASWGPFWWHGRSAFWLKDRIDRRFLAAYQRAVPQPPAEGPSAAPCGPE